MFFGPIGADKGDVAGLDGQGVGFHIGHGYFMVGANMAEVNYQGLAKDTVEGNIHGRFAICLNVFGEINVGTGVEQHLNFARLPESRPPMITRHRQLQIY
jgi:hypothetical protein